MCVVAQIAGEDVKSVSDSRGHLCEELAGRSDQDGTQREWAQRTRGVHDDARGIFNVGTPYLLVVVYLYYQRLRRGHINDRS
eukprot:scaffold306_cov525-Prasinococcus_capsulatus_cf.AAC.27